MAYVALLRGINVGGKSAVDMKQLKTAFEGLGLRNVRTYINSGNVVFTGGGKDRGRLRRKLERAITDAFGLDVAVLLRDTRELGAVVDALAGWHNDDDHKCDVLFSDDFTSAKAVDLLPLTPGLEETRFAAGAILCRVPRARQSKSKLTRLVGTDLYKRMTIRNSNTARKLHDLALEADAAGTSS